MIGIYKTILVFIFVIVLYSTTSNVAGDNISISEGAELYLSENNLTESNSSSQAIPEPPAMNSLTCVMTCIKIENTALNCECILDSLESTLLTQPGLDELTLIRIQDSKISTLNLNLFHNLSRLQSLSVTHSNVSKLTGTLPPSLKRLNLSSNLISALHDSTFLDNWQKSDIMTYSQLLFSIEEIDVSKNNISELPKSIFTLNSLKSVYIAGNKLDGQNFVWDQLYEWTKDSPAFDDLLKDADIALCYYMNRQFFGYSVRGVLEAKRQLETICNDTEITSKCSNCTLFALQKDLEKVEGNYYKDYPLSYNGSLGTIALSLSLNCSDKMLSELPQIPPQTWHLNVSLNKITSLAPLTSPHYKYLQGLDADYNQIDINTLKDAPLLKNYARLSLRFNHFNLISLSLLQSMTSLQETSSSQSDRGKTLLGGNPIDCEDCSSFLEIQRFLQQHRDKMDTKEIYCKSMNEEAIVDIKKPEKVCRIPKSISFDDSEEWIIVLIVIEILLIVSVIAKVWYDQRLYRRTGTLPWISQIMPRLPWDTVLEGLKDIKEHQNTILSNSKQKTTRSGSVSSFQFTSLKRKKNKTNKSTKSVRFKNVRSNSNASQVTIL